MVENVILLNKVTQAKLELDVTKTPYHILDMVDWGQVESNHHSYRYVNQIGIYVTSTTLETRDIEISGWIIAKTEEDMSKRKIVLNGFVNPQQEMVLIYKDYEIEFLSNTSIKYSTVLVENNDVVCKFKIEGLCPDPLFKSGKENVASNSIIGIFHFPLIINKIQQNIPQILFGLKRINMFINAYNNGTVKTGMKIVFKATGVVSNPSLMRVDTLEYFKINKTMENGEMITINTIPGEKKVVGFFNGLEQNYFKYRDLGSTWLQLEIGDNFFKYDADNNVKDLEVYIYYYDRYLEVQGCY